MGEPPLKTAVFLSSALAALPLSAQAWDLRLEAPFPRGQNLPQTLVQGSGQLLSGSLGTGNGVIATVSHRIIRVGPVLKFEWNAELSHLQASGQVQQGSGSSGSQLRQEGVGLGANAQFWVPFTGFAGELGLLERFQTYRFSAAGAAEDKNINRPWLRAGLRWLPMGGSGAYLAASYQEPVTRDRPVQLSSVQDLGQYLAAQGAGQEFQRLWTVGVGISF
jgi:hypothetical protein